MDDISERAWERLNREYGYLEQARVLFRQDDDDCYVQMVFAENQDEDDPIGVIRQFEALVEKGIVPPPHILTAIAKWFRNYVGASGGLSLDAAFGLGAKQRIGHPLKHRLGREERGRILYLMWCLRRNSCAEGKTMSIENAAGRVINEYNLVGLSEDVLKKEYINARADEIFDQASSVLGDQSVKK